MYSSEDTGIRGGSGATQWFYDLKTSTKLWAAFGIISFLTAAVGLVGLFGLRAMDTMLNKIYEDQALTGRYLNEVNNDIRAIARFMRDAIVADADETDKIDKGAGFIAKADAKVRQNLTRLKPIISSAQGQALLDSVEQEYGKWKDSVDRVVSLAQSQNDKEAKSLVEQAGAKGDSIEANLNQLLQQKNEESEQLKIEAAALYARARRSLITMAILGVFLAGVAGYFISRKIRTSIAEVVDLVAAAASGDLTVRGEFNARDEMGRMGEALNGFLENLHQSIKQVAQSSGAVAEASQQLSSASEQLSSGSQQQASSLEETAASLEQITGTVKQNADNARQANQLAMGSRNVAERGGHVVDTAVAAMGEINKSSKKIADIITTIDEIAFQTNLLALNAAVEAARAGEQGKGFAVVAAEVRNLAQRSATAAREIKTLIEDSVVKVESGSELVTKSGQTLGEIVSSVKQVTDIIGEIAAASHEQTAGIDQVNRAVTQMDSVVQSNAAQTEELSSTARSLTTQAQQLQALVAKFKLADAPDWRRQATARIALKASDAAIQPAPAPEQPVPTGRKGAVRDYQSAFEEF
ncbi:MAG TPA: methyl-accepting chemotaxis protein [Candidatus Binatia bacterium]|jgi:methyl-accepting chemotaxis protein